VFCDTQEIADILIRRNPLKINLENEPSDWSIRTYNDDFQRYPEDNFELFVHYVLENCFVGNKYSLYEKGYFALTLAIILRKCRYRLNFLRKKDQLNNDLIYVPDINFWIKKNKEKIKEERNKNYKIKER